MAREIKRGSDIKLRSEKMGTFIGGIPSFLVRISLLVTIVVLAMLLWGIFAFFARCFPFSAFC